MGLARTGNRFTDGYAVLAIQPAHPFSGDRQNSGSRLPSLNGLIVSTRPPTLINRHDLRCTILF